jgi:putative phosphoserine phosphatase/1-acylglycerol-3-phosphate O-acyltransferase
MTGPKQRRQTLRAILTGLLVLSFMSLGALVMLAAAVLTLFRARRFYIEVLGGSLARALLWLLGVRLIVRRDRPWPTTQTVYISNHTSALDVFVLLALGLPNTRFFQSGFIRAIVPLGVIGWLAGNFWTVPQLQPEGRVRVFQRADRILRATGESVYLSPEGARVQTGEVGPFNKGAFHLAGSLGAPLLPLYIAVPLPQQDLTTPATHARYFTVRANLMSFMLDLRPCVVQVYVDSPIDTTTWRLEDLDRNRQLVRQRFLDMHEKWKAASTCAT